MIMLCSRLHCIKFVKFKPMFFDICWSSTSAPTCTRYFFFSSLQVSSLELSDTQSLCASNTSPPRNRCTFLCEVPHPSTLQFPYHVSIGDLCARVLHECLQRTAVDWGRNNVNAFKYFHRKNGSGQDQAFSVVYGLGLGLGHSQVKVVTGVPHSL